MRDIGFLMDEFNQMAEELEQSEKQLTRLARTLETRNEELKNFAYITSHDLRAPLINVQGFSHELAADCSRLQGLLVDTVDTDTMRQKLMPLVNEEIPEMLSFIDTGVEKMQRLLDGLLAVSRVDNASLNVKPLDMNNLIKRVVDSMRYQIRTHDVSVSVDTLPSCLGDSDQINQVFSNIIGNAFKYRDVSRQCLIRISGSIQGGLSVYCVEDNGVGIAPEHQEKVFELFHRAHPADSEPGEGLGLAIVKRVVDRHNGKVWQKSRVGDGTTFFVALPSGSNA